MPDEGKPTAIPGTIQLPRGASIDDVGGTPPAMQATIAPTRAETDPDATAPPAMPADWRYQLGAEIARGGMGRVVEANDTVLGRAVAVKEALSRDPDAVRRFHRETRITAKLEHPSIVPVHDAGTTPGGAPFYVMRKISGRPLEELVARADRLEDRLALLPHVVAAANAVAHAHERGVVHRDIKPPNILVGELGETIVIDWGLAKAFGEPDDHPARADAAPTDDDALKTRAGIVYGTPGFLAPEQLRGAHADEKSDVYALGATLYHLLVRKPPHYTRTGGDAMMKAALDGPPEPIRELLPGVPPELATIVDKALAGDAAARYATAREFAEDLQRFLRGQLVASHHYSRRERVVRFVRKNRALVGVSAAALLAILVGSWIAVSRIVAARDRADANAHAAELARRAADEQREKVTESLAQLTLADARGKAEDDPTRAVAMIKLLATEHGWRQVRAIGAAARAHGVAFGLPASPRVASLVMTRDGDHALAAGDDGIVRMYDLAKREVRELADVKAPARAVFADGERAIVVAAGSALTIVDAATGRARSVATQAPIGALAVSGPIAYWLDDKGAVWKLDVGGSAPERVALEDPIRSLATSPDGRWIALASDARLVLLDRTQPTLPPQQLAEGATRALAWAADGGELAALIGEPRELVAFAMPQGTIEHRFSVGDRFAVATSRGRMLTVGPTGVAIAARDASRERKVDGVYALGLHEARDGIVVAGGAQGLIAVIGADDDLIVKAPAKLARLAASPASSWVVAASDGELLVWDLAAIVPHRYDRAASGARFVGGDAMIATYTDPPFATWIDLRDDTTAALPAASEGILDVVAAPDGSRAVLIDGSHRARIVSPKAAAQDLEGDVELAAFADDDRLAIAISDGTVRLEARERRVVTAHPAGIAALAARGDWIAVAYKDGGLARTNLATGRTQTLAGIAGVSRDALVVERDGVVLFATGDELRAWQPDGTAATLAKLDKPIRRIARTSSGATLIMASDGSLHVLGTAATTSAGSVAQQASLGNDGLIASVSPDGLLEVVDALAGAGERWTLAAPKGRSFTGAQISPDGRRVLARVHGGIRVWNLALPDSRDTTAAWLGALTNANATAGPSAPLDWPR